MADEFTYTWDDGSTISMDASGTVTDTPSTDTPYDAGISWNDVTSSMSSVAKAVGSAASAASPFLAYAANITAAGAQQAAAYYQQGLYQVQAADTLRLAQIRTDMDQKYAAIQAGRKLQQAEMQSMNYTIQGNTLLRNMERSNAAVRARAAANGVVYNEGSAASIQTYNINQTYRDVGITNINALAARIMGYEDASAMVLAAKEQADLTMNAAQTQADQLNLAGDFAVKSGGLLSGATLVGGTAQFLNTVHT